MPVQRATCSSPAHLLTPPPPTQHPPHTTAPQVKRGIQWLAAPRQEHLRLAGVLLLRELAEAAPAIFNVHVRAFIEVVWNPLRDSRQHVREAAVAALRACLVLVEKRETRYRVQWYYRLFEETQRGLTRVTSLETVHGSLLALGELLRHTGAPRAAGGGNRGVVLQVPGWQFPQQGEPSAGCRPSNPPPRSVISPPRPTNQPSGEFMLARYREVCDTVLRFRDSKEKLVRRAVTSLVPRLAAFAPERFVKSYLKQVGDGWVGGVRWWASGKLGDPSLHVVGALHGVDSHAHHHPINTPSTPPTRPPNTCCRCCRCPRSAEPGLRRWPRRRRRWRARAWPTA